MAKRKAPSTAWKPGQTGNPEGKRQEKLIADQLRLVLMDIDPASGYKNLRVIAEKIVEQAKEGQAAQQMMVLERIDGKVPQAHDIKKETTVTIHAEAVSDFDRWLAGAASRKANGAHEDVGSERSVLPDTVPPKSTRH